MLEHMEQFYPLSTIQGLWFQKLWFIRKRFEIVRTRPTYDEIFDKEAIPTWE